MKLYKFSKYFGKSGELESIFIAEAQDVADLISNKTLINFGEVLGKHIDVSCVIEEGDIKQLDVLDSTIDDLILHIGNTISGYNPLDYNEEEDEL